MAIKVFDFFSGCGGASKGFQLAGLDILFAMDNDPDAAHTYQKNFADVEFSPLSIQNLSPDKIDSLVEKCGDSPKLFCGCAPCQPFTKQNTHRKKNDNRIPLLNYFMEFVRTYKPEYIFIENVPGIQKVISKSEQLSKFNNFLDNGGYKNKIDCRVIASRDFGVPQRRRRFFLIASNIAPINFPKPTYGLGSPNLEYSKVQDWINDLPSISAGEEHPDVPNHRAAKLSELNLKRIQATPDGGDWRDWPSHLKNDCHTKRDYSGHTDVYGRMRWDKPATGLTTRCTSYSNGRFGHPDQNRAISVREAACLQTFPRDFNFTGSLNAMARQIGNAVPVNLAKVFGHHFIRHYNLNGMVENG